MTNRSRKIRSMSAVSSTWYVMLTPPFDPRRSSTAVSNSGASFSFATCVSVLPSSDRTGGVLGDGHPRAASSHGESRGERRPDLPLLRSIGEPFEEGADAALLAPLREQDEQRAAGGRIRVLIDHDVDGIPPSVPDQREGLRALAPRFASQRLQV